LLFTSFEMGSKGKYSTILSTSVLVVIDLWRSVRGEREYAFHTSLISQWVSCWLRWSHFRFWTFFSVLGGSVKAQSDAMTEGFFDSIRFDSIRFDSNKTAFQLHLLHIIINLLISMKTDVCFIPFLELKKKMANQIKMS
jgi:hypothetical protein